MRIVNIEDTQFGPAFDIEMASVSQIGEQNQVTAAFGRIEPGRETAPHEHDEAEAFVILSGHGEVVVSCTAHPVRAGSLVIFEPFELHVLRNTGDHELRFLDLYWRDPMQRAAAAGTHVARRLAGRPVFVFSTPPTPNGDLHLGHLSGPYLGADVYVRFQRMNGIEAYHLTGSDDHQSYVVARARQESSTPAEVAARYAAEIHATLSLMDIYPDQYTITSTDPGYADGLRSFFSRVVAAGAERCRRPGLFDGETGAYLYESDVAGECPSCGSPSGGNICEECGEPNTCVEFAVPRSRLSAAPPRRGNIERYCLRLDAFKDVVFDHHNRSKISPKLQELAARVLAREEFHLPITHPSPWGISPAEPVEGRQVVWVWPEMAYGFLHGIAQLGRRLGRDWRADLPQVDWKIVHFFGYDNSFYHTILYPILYHLAYPDWQCDIDYNENQFYLLDGLKFSTSRRHAVWGKDILKPDTVDAVRYYLAWTRGEHERTNFTVDDCHSTVNEVLVGRWQAWLTDLGRRVTDEFHGRAPDAGSWTPYQTGFFNRLHIRLATVKAMYDADAFTLNGVVNELNGLVEDALRFSDAYGRIRRNSVVCLEYRTAIAVELAAARLLAQTAAPLLPRFSDRLAQALGGISLACWPAAVDLIPPGSVITLQDEVFFVSIKAQRADSARSHENRLAN